MKTRRGAVLVEFVVALVPLLTMFFGFVQLSKIAAARLMVKHAAIVGARCAAVTTNEKKNTPGQKEGANVDDTQRAVKAALGPWWNQGGVTAVDVTIDDKSTRDDPYDWVEVKVRATYACRVPMGILVCGGRSKILEETYKMPHQGAVYIQ